jgi:DNA-binding NarL/FixJ family response regulator
VSNKLIRVLVADDHAVVREGVRKVLSKEHGFEVVAEAEDGMKTLALAEEHRPDVVVLDLTMPGVSGLEIAVKLRETASEAGILILTMHERGEYVLEAVRAGALGYVLKDTGPAELRESVRAVFRGDEFFSPQVTATMSAALRSELAREHRQGLIEGLSPREREVLALVASGDTNKEIGSALGISPRTVESHRESLVKKLKIRTVAELTRFAVETGLVDL